MAQDNKLLLAKKKLAQKKREQLTKLAEREEATKVYIDQIKVELAEVAKANAETATVVMEAMKRLDNTKELEGVYNALSELSGKIDAGFKIDVAAAPVNVTVPKPEVRVAPSNIPKWMEDSKVFVDIQTTLNKIQKDAVGQQPSDFVPMRRVKKVGNSLVFDDDAWSGGVGGGGSSSNGLTDAQLRATPVDVNVSGDPTYYTGTITAAAVNVVGLIDGGSIAFLELHHRGTLGQFKATVLVEGTDSTSATGDEAAGAASTAVGWTSLEVRSATGGEMSSIVLGGRYFLYNPPRKIRIRCSSYTFGTIGIDVMTKPVSQQDPSRTISDKDALASLAMTTFGQAQVTQRTFLAGSNFDTAPDSDVWTDLSANSGSQTTANGVLEIHTNTSATGKSGVRSRNLATVLGAADNAITIRAAVDSVTNGLYLYRFGAYTDTEGTFIQLAGNARTVTDAVFNATTTMTSATAAFTAADLGKRITSSGNVTIGTTIVKIVSTTSVLLSAAALTSASGQTIDIEGFGVVYVNRTGGVDTTSTFGVIGFSTPTIAANSQQIWEITMNPNFLIVRNSGNFAQLQIGSSVLSPMYATYNLPLAAEAINIGSTSDHVLYLQTLTAERLGQPHSIRANETFEDEAVLSATAAVIHARQPDGDDVALRADGLAEDLNGVAVETSTPLAGGASYQSGWIDTDGWSSVEIVVKTDQLSATDGILIEFTADSSAVTPTVISNRKYTFTADDIAKGSQTFRFNAELDGMRVKYTNGATIQGSFYLSATLRVQNVNPQGGIEGSLGVTNTAVMTRGVIAAKKPDDTYANIESNDSGHLYVASEFDTTIDTFESTTGWTALNGDTTNIALTTNHVRGAKAITFDKADTAANSVFAAIQKTITSIDLSEQAKSGLLGGQFYIPDTTNVNYVFVRLGTDSSNYNEWRIAAADIANAEWDSTLDMILNQPSHAGNTGNGWNPASVTYICVGVAFNLQSNTLTGIIFDSIFAFSVNHTSAQISTSVSTPNININQVKGTTTAVNGGNLTNGTLRVVEATNSQLNTTVGDSADAATTAGGTGSLSAKLRKVTTDTDASATSLAIIDDWDESDRAKANIIVGQAGVQGGSGTVSANTQRVVLATDVALPTGSNAIGKLAANSGVDIGDVDVTSLPATPAGTNLIGATTPGASATVGTGTSHFRDPAVTNTAVAIKASAGKLHGYNLYNPNASLAYVHFYNVAAASVTVGTTTPIRSIALPSTANGTVAVDTDLNIGIAFSTAMSVAASTTATGGTAPGSALVVNAHYI